MRASLLLRSVLSACLLLRAARAQSCAAITSPAPCGQVSDSEERCLFKGCCYNASSPYPCFYPGGNAVPVTHVHVVQASHFDAGFAYTIEGVLQLWWYTHFPRVLRLGLEIEAMTPAPAYGMKFMAQCWLIDTFFNCPPGVPGLVCPTPAQQANLTLAISKGFLTWHAFPFNSEAELHSSWLLRAGLASCHALDARFGLPPKATMSQRDVPGTTRGVVPLLASAGVRAFSIGANGASTPPFVPRAFVWRDAASGATLPTMVHPYGYGGLADEDAVRVPGLGHVLVTEWEGDNQGPPGAVSDIAADWAGLEKLYPGAAIFSSTFDAFVEQLAQPAVLAQLPVVQAELGDTWVHGAASDPQRTAYMKRAAALAGACVAAGGCALADPVFANFTRMLLKCGEHTWGADIKTFLHDTENWTNAQLAAQLAANASNFGYVLATWAEQRAWCIDLSLGALVDGGHALAPAVAAALADLTPDAPPSPAADGFAPFAAGAVYAAGRWSIGFDAATGAIATLVDTTTGQVWANLSADGSKLAWPHYVTLSADDFATLTGPEPGGYYPGQGQPPGWYLLDFGKPNVSSANPLHQEVAASLVALYLKETPAVASFLVQTSFSDAALHTYYGAPAAMWLRVDVPRLAPAGAINCTFEIYGKTPTRLPEGFFLRFNASRSYAGAPAPLTWTVNTLGAAIDAFDVVQGGNHHLHGFSEGIAAVKPHASAPATLTFASDDVGVAGFGRPWPLPNPVFANSSDITEGASFLLLDNTWVRCALGRGGTPPWASAAAAAPSPPRARRRRRPASHRCASSDARQRSGKQHAQRAFSRPAPYCRARTTQRGCRGRPRMPTCAGGSPSPRADAGSHACPHFHGN